MKTILYLGNDLASKSKYHSAYATLKSNLKKEGYHVITASSKQNQWFRLMDMVLHLFKYRNKVDVVLIDTFSTKAFYFSWISSQIARVLKLPYVPILHGGNLPNRLKKSPYLATCVFKYASMNVAPSGYLKHEFEKHNFTTILIPNAIGIANYCFYKRKQIQPKLLYVRAFATIYNPTMAVEVLRKLLEKYPNAELCMVGPDRDGSLAEVKTLIHTYGLQDKIKITGVLPKEAWHQLSKNYDVFINTTDVDNTPVSLIEAMALGIPIVTTNVGGIPYLVSNNQQALLVPPKDSIAMCNAVSKLIENPETTEQLSSNGRHKAAQMDWEVVKKQWIKLISNVT